jgi:hypothetical protein
MTSYIAFARRIKQDSTIDSICTKCYQIAASAENEQELLILEKDHVCDPNLASSAKHSDSMQGTF